MSHRVVENCIWRSEDGTGKSRQRLSGLGRASDHPRMVLVSVCPVFCGCWLRRLPRDCRHGTQRIQYATVSHRRPGPAEVRKPTLVGTLFRKAIMSGLNCWELKQCGRQPGGSKAKQFGVCPASIERSLHGSNHGTNGGRACWVIAGTLCGGEVQGTFAAKMMNCTKCDFFLSVREEEGAKFADHRVLLVQLRKNA